MFVSKPGIPRPQPGSSVADRLFGESALAVYGAIVLLRTSEQSDTLAFRSLNQKTLEGCFTMHAVTIDDDSSAEDNLKEVHRALDERAGLLVIAMTDHSHEQRMKYEMEAAALKYAAENKIPVLFILPSWDHLFRRHLSAAILANTRGAFLQFQQGSHANTLAAHPKTVFKKIRNENVLHWPEWQGRKAVRECLGRIVRRGPVSKK